MSQLPPLRQSLKETILPVPKWVYFLLNVIGLGLRLGAEADDTESKSQASCLGSLPESVRSHPNERN